MSIRPVDIEQVVERCTWCRTPLAPEMRVVIAGGQFAPGSSARLENLRGRVVQVRTLYGTDPVTAIVPLPATPAHAAGYDLLFVLCSAACRDALDRAIGDEAMMVRPADAERAPHVSRATAAKGRSATARRRPALPRQRPS